MKNVKRLKKEASPELKPTRTLLVSGIKTQEENEQIRAFISKQGEVKEMYTIQDSVHVLFAIMYDIRDSEKALNGLRAQGKSVTYTVSKYEIPREVDRCDETKNQGTLLLVSRDLDAPFTEEEVRKMFEGFGTLKCIREYKTFQRFIEFYDSRSAVAAQKKLHETAYGKGTIIIRFVWDTTTKQRWAMINNTDAILKAADLDNRSMLRRDADASKKIYEKNEFLRALDDFIINNLDKIEKYV